MATGGSIESISLAGRQFAVVADNEVQRKLGGFENDMRANGDGTSRDIKTRVTSMLSGVTVAVDDLNNDQEFLQDLADRPGKFTTTISLASGVTYQGLMQINGEINYSTENAAATFDMAGDKLTQQ